jgi:hypothetical protein
MEAVALYKKGKDRIVLKVDLTPRQRQVLVAGGLLNYIRSTQQRS